MGYQRPLRMSWHPKNLRTILPSIHINNRLRERRTKVPESSPSSFPTNPCHPEQFQVTLSLPAATSEEPMPLGRTHLSQQQHDRRMRERIPYTKLDQPLQVSTLDGRPLGSGSVHFITAPLRLYIGGIGQLFDDTDLTGGEPFGVQLQYSGLEASGASPTGSPSRLLPSTSRSEGP
ncbi:hypothetical protein AAFF_G00399870 [Aldrovandia affinis]|uniref:Uncharacterized protein n=1 Tax=Aldrovandia affinis TaxID=143900 RepID=A0AAD7SDI7_9TELE|nr:hypothetical protein AAFF_G00399870 [Aldrovandia affinis]